MKITTKQNTWNFEVSVEVDNDVLTDTVGFTYKRKVDEDFKEDIAALVEDIYGFENSSPAEFVKLLMSRMTEYEREKFYEECMEQFETK